MTRAKAETAASPVIALYGISMVRFVQALHACAYRVGGEQKQRHKALSGAIYGEIKKIKYAASILSVVTDRIRIATPMSLRDRDETSAALDWTPHTLAAYLGNNLW